MYMYIDYGWRTALWSGRSTVILLVEGIWGENLHSFSIKNICRITTLACFKDIWKMRLVIYKFTNSVNLQIHHTTTLN